MFIYKITINGQIYFGMDSNPPDRQHRWKAHIRESKNLHTNNLLHQTMYVAGIDNCQYEVVEEGFDSLSELGAAEIRYIAEYDTYRNGLNSSPGGDGLGKHDLYLMSDDEIAEVKAALSKAMSDYNTKIKWANTTSEERSEMTRNWWYRSTEERSATTKEYWENVSEEKRNHQLRGLKSRWKNVPFEERSRQNKARGLKGAEKVSIKIKVELDDGEIIIFNSKNDYARKFGHDIKSVLKKTKLGESHNGKKAWEL